jgi:hypothetical protein
LAGRVDRVARSAVRLERLDQFAFGQRAFATADPAAWSDVVAAIRVFPRVPP